GFTGSSEVEFDVEVDASDPVEREQPERPNPIEEEDDSTAGAGEEANGPDFWDRASDIWDENKAKILWALGGLLVLAGILYKIRQKWLPKVLIPYYRNRGESASTFEKAYLRLLKQLELYGIKRREGQTLKSFASYIDSFFGTSDMTRLTRAYEQAVYGGNPESVDWNELKESWENLINRTSG